MTSISNNLAYLYDGSTEGLFTCIFLSYRNKEIPNDICLEENFQQRIGQEVIYVRTDLDLAIRVRDGLRRRLGNRIFRKIFKASLSGDPSSPYSVFRFVRYSMDKAGKKAIDDLSNENVSGFFEAVRAFDFESERIRQFARFEHILIDDGQDIWFSKIAPKDNVIPFVMSHFVERFNTQRLIIFDEIRCFAGIYDGKSISYGSFDSFDNKVLATLRSNEEELMQNAWRAFYRSLFIEDRYNPELRRNFMPVRFWNNLTELQPMTHRDNE